MQGVRFYHVIWQTLGGGVAPPFHIEGFRGHRSAALGPLVASGVLGAAALSHPLGWRATSSCTSSAGSLRPVRHRGSPELAGLFARSQPRGEHLALGSSPVAEPRALHNLLRSVQSQGPLVSQGLSRQGEARRLHDGALATMHGTEGGDDKVLNPRSHANASANVFRIISSSRGSRLC